MSASGDYVLWQRKTTSVEGRHRIFSERPVSEYPSVTTSATNSLSSSDLGTRR